MHELIQDLASKYITDLLKANALDVFITCVFNGWDCAVSATNGIKRTFKKLLSTFKIFTHRVKNENSRKTRTLEDKIILKKWFKKLNGRKLTKDELEEIINETKLTDKSIRKWMSNNKFRKRKTCFLKEKKRNQMTFKQEKILKRFFKRMREPQQKPTREQIEQLIEKTSLSKKRIEQFFAYKRFIFRKNNSLI
jgi:hypothetical protein